MLCRSCLVVIVEAGPTPFLSIAAWLDVCFVQKHSSQAKFKKKKREEKYHLKNLELALNLDTWPKLCVEISQKLEGVISRLLCRRPFEPLCADR